MTALRNGSAMWRLSALTIFVVLPIVFFGLAANGLIAALETQADAQSADQLLKRLEARRAATSVGGSPSAASRLFLRGETRPLAESILRERLVQSVSANGGRLIETRTNALPAATNGADGDISLSLTLDIDNAGLSDFLRTIEGGLPFMNVGDVSIRRMASPQDESDNPILRVDLTIQSPWQAEGEQP